MLRNHRVYRPYKPKRKNIPAYLLKILIFTLFFYFLVTNLFLGSYRVSAVSMTPVIKKGDRLFTSPLSYGIRLPFIEKKTWGMRKPERGDIVLVKSPAAKSPGFPLSLANMIIKFFTFNIIDLNPSQDLYTVKRVIGVPGDILKLENFISYIKIPGNEEFISEILLSNQEYTPDVQTGTYPEIWEGNYPISGELEERILGENQYFLLGDNRLYANDSRSWGSPVDESMIITKILFRYFPFTRIGIPK